MKKDILRSKLDTIKLPIDKPDTKKSPETYDKHYLPVLEELGVRTRADIDKLREAVDDKIVQMSDREALSNEGFFFSCRLTFRPWYGIIILRATARGVM